MNALVKIDDTLATADQEGADIALVTDAQVALKALRIDEGRSLSQESIAEAISELKPATGEGTGTTLVQSELPGRRASTARDWGFLMVSLLLVAAGVALAAEFRPQDNLRTLRRCLGGESPSTPNSASPRKANHDDNGLAGLEQDGSQTQQGAQRPRRDR